MSKENPIIRLESLISIEIFETNEFLMGEILTIIDASISDKEQRKCLKDLMRKVFHNPENTKWFHHRIRKIILEFNEKFAKIPITPTEKKYLETGETQQSESIAESIYFE
jgi:hypothetical protein